MSESWLDKNRDESPRRNWRDEDRPKSEPEPACVICKADCIPLNDAGECAECEPNETETCEEWLEKHNADTVSADVARRFGGEEIK